MSRPEGIIGKSIPVILFLLTLVSCVGNSELQAPLLPKEIEHRIQSIRVETPLQTHPLTFERRENGWYFIFDGHKAYPANEPLILAFLAELTSKNTVKTIKDDNLAAYGFNTNEAIHVFLEDYSHNFSISFGKLDPVGLDVWIVRPDGSLIRSPFVYKTLSDLRVSTWLNLSILEKMSAYNLLSIRSLESTVPAPADWRETFGSFRCADLTNVPFKSEEILYFEFADAPGFALESMPLGGGNRIVSISGSGLLYIVRESEYEILKEMLRK